MPEKFLPFTSHLEELRRRVLIVLFSFLFFFGVSFYFVEALLPWLKMPAGDSLGTLAVFSPTAALLSFMKIAFAVALVFSLPVFLWQLWFFIAPALEARHAKKGLFFIVLGWGLFVLGMLFSFFYLLPPALHFLLSIGKGEIQFIISLDSYLSFVLFLMLGTGVVFEMPVLVFFLSKWGWLTAQKMLKGWRLAVVVILVLAAVVTPTPDPINMFFMAVPMVLLYLLSILVAAWAGKKEEAQNAH